jgi:hypothetical protein
MFWKTPGKVEGFCFVVSVILERAVMVTTTACVIVSSLIQALESTDATLLSSR